jgi:hypothetical protein
MILTADSDYFSTLHESADLRYGDCICKVYSALNIKITDFWEVMPCSLGDDYQRFGGTCALCVQYTTMNLRP